VELTEDPRFLRGIALFNDGDYLEASDCFEELFFEGVRDEPDFIRIFLQFSVGIFHAQTGQWRPAVERIEEGLRLVAAIENDRGIDLVALSTAMVAAATALREKSKPAWPEIAFHSGVPNS
jgi:predicted metal-dependent hydrolase